MKIRHNRHLWADCLENVGASTSHNSMGFRGLLQEYLAFFTLLSLHYFKDKEFILTNPE
jgi:hypothetical protein